MSQPFPPAVAEASAETPRAQAYMNPYLAGLGLGLVLLASFVVMGRGLGASGAYKSAVAWLEVTLAPGHANSYLADSVGDGSSSPLKTWLVFEMLGVFLGALLSGLLAGRVRGTLEKGPRASRQARLAGAFGGGLLTAVGAQLARGCTSGQALTGGALLNAGSWAFMLCVFAGAYGAAYFVRWQWR